MELPYDGLQTHLCGIQLQHSREYFLRDVANLKTKQTSSLQTPYECRSLRHRVLGSSGASKRDI